MADFTIYNSMRFTIKILHYRNDVPCKLLIWDWPSAAKKHCLRFILTVNYSVRASVIQTNRYIKWFYLKMLPKILDVSTRDLTWKFIIQQLKPRASVRCAKHIIWCASGLFQVASMYGATVSKPNLMLLFSQHEKKLVLV